MPTPTDRPRPSRRALAAAALALVVALPASPAHARDDDEELETPDARYEGYAGTGVQLGDGSVATSYLLLAGLAVLAAGVMFKDAKRSHLD